MSDPGGGGIDPALVERFRSGVLQSLGHVPLPEERIALAVSGGPDSMAMLALAAAAFPGQITAATVDHRLRAEAAEEAAMVARWCDAAAIPHATLRGLEYLNGSDVQARARTMRYKLLARWVLEAGGGCLATAHHADDQAETFLMRAVRGSGVAGLAAIRRRRDHSEMESVGGQGFRELTVTVIRPLLDWRRADLRKLVSDAGIPFVDDPSNRDDHYERVRVRRLLSEQPWLDVPGLARAAQHAAEADQAMEEFRDWLWTSRAVAADDAAMPDEVRLDFGALPRELRRRLARQAIGLVRARQGIALPAFDSATNIEPLLDSLERGRAATTGGVLVSRRDDVWHFREAPPRRSR